MDKIDLEYLQEATVVVQAPTLVSPFKQASTIAFTLLTEDLDVINKVHIIEGSIDVGKIQELSTEETKELFFQFPGMIGEEWKYAEEKLPISAYRGEIRIEMSKASTSEVCDGIKAVVEKVIRYPNNKEKLVITTDHSFRIQALAITTSNLIHQTIIKDQKSK